MPGPGSCPSLEGSLSGPPQSPYTAAQQTHTDIRRKADVTSEKHILFCLTWPLNLPHYGNSIVECLLRSDSQCKTAQRAGLSPLPVSFLPGQTERKPSSS